MMPFFFKFSPYAVRRKPIDERREETKQLAMIEFPEMEGHGDGYWILWSIGQ